MTPLTPARPICIRANEIKLDIDDDGSIDNNRIHDKITNLSSFIKKISSGIGFFTFKASLVFIKLRKTFIKALILYHLDLKYYVLIETVKAGQLVNY